MSLGLWTTFQRQLHDQRWLTHKPDSMFSVGVEFVYIFCFGFYLFCFCFVFVFWGLFCFALMFLERRKMNLVGKEGEEDLRWVGGGEKYDQNMLYDKNSLSSFPFTYSSLIHMFQLHPPLPPLLPVSPPPPHCSFIALQKRAGSSGTTAWMARNWKLDSPET